MDVMVRVPSSLKKWFEGRDEVLCQGETVGECIGSLVGSFPGLKHRLQDGEGGINSDVLVFLNGENIQGLKEGMTPVRPGDVIGIIPFAAGG
ncbi:MAG: MoaD/ThiS family protein [Desulfatiglans sp.]|jgi:molybdopterin converting factor small subunit|nr:MoaD/ThiS family protein [Thermodesulfobacteriota bacterium]MEE4353541.1 MoaD/ThiS family protein [Desulfatiglans sp.]